MAKVGPYGLSDIGEFNITWNRLAPIRWIGGIRKSTAVTSSPYLTIAFLSLTEATIFSAPEKNFECNTPATQAQSVLNQALVSTIPPGRLCRMVSVRVLRGIT